MSPFKLFNTPSNPKSLSFRPSDCADTSITRTKNFQELLYARSKIATYARAYKLEAIDMVCTALHDPSQLQLECQSARELGFSGKQAIHPDQVETILNTFVPSDKGQFLLQPIC